MRGQGVMFILFAASLLAMNVLFICNQNKHRSKTAEDVFRSVCVARSAGLYNEHPVTKEQIAQADVVVVMEDAQRSEIAKRFPSLYLTKRILCWNIPDIYRFGQPELVDALKEKAGDLLTEPSVIL